MFAKKCGHCKIWFRYNFRTNQMHFFVFCDQLSVSPLCSFGYFLLRWRSHRRAPWREATPSVPPLKLKSKTMAQPFLVVGLFFDVEINFAVRIWWFGMNCDFSLAFGESILVWDPNRNATENQQPIPNDQTASSKPKSASKTIPKQWKSFWKI